MGMDRLLPRTNSRTLKLTVTLLVLVCALQGCYWLFRLVQAPFPGAVVMLVAWSLLGTGLWRLSRIARGLMVALLWFVVIALIIGTFNPFTAGDLMAERGEAPSIWMLLAWVGPGIAVCLVVLHVLGKYKAEFGRPAAPEARE